MIKHLKTNTKDYSAHKSAYSNKVS